MLTARRIVSSNHAPTGHPRWVVEGVGGSPKLVSSAAEIRDLLDQGRISPDSWVFEITTEARRLANVPELAPAIGDALFSAPPIRPSPRSLERTQLSEELAILDRPLVDDVEYYDPEPSSRSRRLKIGLLALGIAGLGAGLFAASNGPSWTRRLAASRPVLAAPSAAVAAAEPGPAGQRIATSSAPTLPAPRPVMAEWAPPKPIGSDPGGPASRSAKQTGSSSRHSPLKRAHRRR